MNPVDIIILSIIGTAIFAIVRRSFKKKKTGCSGCEYCSNRSCPSHSAHGTEKISLR